MKPSVELILVPIDFSDYSLNACYFALHLSSRLNSEIKLFHAFFNPMIDAMTFPDTFTYQSNMAEVFRDMEKNAEKEIKKFTKKIKKYAKIKDIKNVRITTEVVSGQPAEEIDTIIKSCSPGLITIGTRGHGKQSGEALGSMAAHVIDSFGIPVLLVTQDARLKEDEEIKVLYATNFDESDYNAIKNLISILDNFRYRIDCVHFITKNDTGDYQKKMAELKKYFSKNYKSAPLDCHITESEDILSGLNTFVEDHDIDLISLTHKKRNLFYRLLNPSLAKKLLFKTKRPVFVFN